MSRNERINGIASLIVLLFVGPSIFACAGDDDPIRLSLDGSFVFGDAQPADAESIDAGELIDTGEINDAGPMDDDAASMDAAPDAPADAGFTDTGIPALCGATSTVTVSADDVPSMATELDGQLIIVVGTATAGAVVCPQSCTPNDPCCEDCTAPVLVGDIELSESVCFSSPGCLGNACLLACQPPAPPISEMARYLGVFRAGPPLRLELIDVE